MAVGKSLAEAFGPSFKLGGLGVLLDVTLEMNFCTLGKQTLATFLAAAT